MEARLLASSSEDTSVLRKLQCLNLAKRDSSLYEATVSLSLGRGLDKQDLATRLAVRLQKICSIPYNSTCCDCSSKSPMWVSLTFGCIMCIRCSGVHRSLGSSVSRVRSIDLDTWTEAQVKSLEKRGNGVVNQILEAEIPDSVKKPTAETPMEQLIAYIKAKYAELSFRHKPQNENEQMQYDADTLLLSYQIDSFCNNNTNESGDGPITDGGAPLESPSRSRSCIIARFNSPRDPSSSSSVSQSLSNSSPAVPLEKNQFDGSPRSFSCSSVPVPYIHLQSGKRASMKLQKQELEQLCWEQLEKKGMNVTSEELMRQQQLERKRMFQEAKKKKKEKKRMSRDLTSLFSINSNNNNNNASTTVDNKQQQIEKSNASSESENQTGFFTKERKRLSRDFTSLFSINTDRLLQEKERENSESFSSRGSKRRSKDFTSFFSISDKDKIEKEKQERDRIERMPSVDHVHVSPSDGASTTKRKTSIRPKSCAYAHLQHKVDSDVGLSLDDQRQYSSALSQRQRTITFPEEEDLLEEVKPTQALNDDENATVDVLSGTTMKLQHSSSSEDLTLEICEVQKTKKSLYQKILGKAKKKDDNNKKEKQAEEKDKDEDHDNTNNNKKKKGSQASKNSSDKIVRRIL